MYVVGRVGRYGTYLGRESDEMHGKYLLVHYRWWRHKRGTCIRYQPTPYQPVPPCTPV
jgi:hypothetical protein